MKKALFVCNTNYQIIVAIKITLSYNYSSTLILTENIKDADLVKSKLEKQNVFDSVFVVKEKKKNSFGHILNCVFGIRLEKNEFYDEFIAFNFDILTHEIFATVNKRNKNIGISQMEEGIISYKTEDTTCGVLEVSYKLRKLLRKDNLKLGAEPIKSKEIAVMFGVSDSAIRRRPVWEQRSKIYSGEWFDKEENREQLKGVAANF